MTSLREIKEKGYIPQKTYLKMMIGGGLTLSKTLLLNLGDLKKLRTLPANAERFIRPKRPYEIPKYDPSMKHGVTDEKYLRPTLYCDPRSPEIVAYAHKLGAYKKSDYEYAKDTFHFVKENLTLEILPFNPVEETLIRGSGTCFHLITLYIALCRAAGIKARYKMFAMNMIKAWYDAVVDVDPLVKKWYDSMGYFMIEGEGEVFIDGEWKIAHVGPKAERQAAAGIPISQFGEDSLGSWFTAIPGTIMIMESIPYGLGGATRFLKKLAPGSMERVNMSIIKQIEKGGEIIKEAGGYDLYDAQIRKKSGPKAPSMKLKGRKEIVFE